MSDGVECLFDGEFDGSGLEEHAGWCAEDHDGAGECGASSEVSEEEEEEEVADGVGPVLVCARGGVGVESVHGRWEKCVW